MMDILTAIGFRGCKEKEEGRLPCAREEGFSNNERWQGEIQQSTVANGGGAKGGARQSR
jgi:hypothetical protein